MPTLTIRLFGPPTIERDGQPVAIDTRKAFALLAYLALTARPVGRATLANLLWPDYDPTRAAANLRRTLWSLNQALGEGRLVTDQDRVTLVAAPDMQIDVVEFNRLLAGTREHAHPTSDTCAACRAPLADAVNLARGDFLEGLTLADAVEFDDWQALTTVNLRNNLADALRRLTAAHLAATDLPAALSTAERWVALDPLDQTAAHQLMLLLAWNDQHAAALRTFRELERRVDSELGLPPEPALSRLFDAIKARQEPPPPGAAPSWTLPTVVPMEEAPPLPAFFDAAHAARMPRFVAREHELAVLDGHLKAALHGQGRVIFVTGEAGQGKTALLAAFARQAAAANRDLVSASGACNAYTGIGDPYLPFREILARLTGDVEAAVVAGSLDREQAVRLWHGMPSAAQALVEHGPDLLDTFVPVRPLLARGGTWLPAGTRQVLAERVARPAVFDPTKQQASLFDQATRVLAALARHRPLLLVLDDLQWGDAGSLALLFHLSRHLAGLRVLILGAYRPNDVALGRQGERHPLEPVVHEIERVQGESRIDLAQAPGRAFVDALLDSEPHRLDATFRAELFHQTGGHPLFTAELLRGMQERGDLVRDAAGSWILQPSLDWQRLPARVEAVIGERLGRLPAELRQLLRAASVEGEEFSAEVAAQLVGMEEAEARRRLSSELERQHQLVRALGIQRVGGTRLTRYRFHHYLIQRGLYASLDAAERAVYNEDAGVLLERLYAGQTEEIAVALARHFDAAGLPEKAIDYYQQAGDRAVRLSANAEAADLYRRALELHSALPATPARLQQELALQAAYSVPVQHLEGWGSPRVEAAFDRALELAQLFDYPPPTLPLLGRIAHAWVYGGQHQRAMGLARQLLRLASQEEDDATLLEAHTVVGLTHFYMGEFSAAQPHLDLAVRLYDPAAHAHLTYLYGQDAGVHVGLFRMLNLTMLGYVERGRAQGADSLALAEQIGHPFTLAFAWGYLAFNACLAFDREAVHATAERCLAIARAHAFPTWLAFSMALRGYAHALRGDVEEGLNDMIKGLEIALPTGAQTPVPFMFGLLADLQGALGKHGDALGLLDAGLAIAAQNHEGLAYADLHRRRGMLLLEMGRPWAEADAELQAAMATAQQQQARLHELRALTTRLRLAREYAPAEVRAAHAALAAAYAWFSEGLTAPDLLAARDELDR